MESDGPRVVAEAIASLANLVKAVAGNSNKESIPPEAMSETLLHSPKSLERLREREEAIMKPRNAPCQRPPQLSTR